MLFKVMDLCCCIAADMFVRIIVPFSRLYKCCARRNRKQCKKNILIFSCDLLGDNIIRLPFFLALRTRFPRDQYHISVVLTQPLGDFFGKLDIFDEIIEDGVLNERHSIFWLFGKRRFACGAIRWAFRNEADILIWALRTRSFGWDLVQRLSSPRISVAYSSDDTKLIFPATAWVQERFYDGKYDLLVPSRMGVCRLDDLNVMNQKLADSAERLDIGGIGVYLKTHLEKVNIAGLPENFVVLVPGAGAALRQWPTRRFAELADRLGGDFVIVGSKAEKRLGDEIVDASKSGARFVNLCGKTSLEQLGAILAKASLVVTNETGTATYAAMIGTPTVCILGGGDFGAFFPNPYCKNTRAVYHKEPCFYCRWQCTKGCAHGAAAPCIDSISVDEVYDAVADLLKKDSCR